jgi:Uma2 family endonuclease
VRWWPVSIRRIGDALRRPCEIIAEAGIVVPERADSYYQADLAVTCAGLTGAAFVRDPVLIVEVLSPAAARADLERKVPDYRSIGSLKEILVVSSVEPRVEHLCRAADGWKVRDFHRRGTLRSEVLGITLDIEELYGGLNLEAPAAPTQESPTR